MSTFGKKPRNAAGSNSRKIAVIGNGMVGARLCEKLVQYRLNESDSIVVFGEEPVPAYDRVRLSNFVLNRDPARLELLPREWYDEHGIELHTGNRVTRVLVDQKEIITEAGDRVGYDVLVFATGSRPFVPSIPGADLPNVFVYRTIEDIRSICEAAKSAKSAAVLGGGLLGIEAAQALQHLDVSEVHVVQLANFLMSQQLNPDASEVLEKAIEDQDIEVHLGIKTESIKQGKDKLHLSFSTGSDLDTDLVVVAAGIRPRSELAEKAGISLGGRGGIRVNDELMTDAPNVYAVGECAEHNNKVYGLAAPGFQMASVLAERLSGNSKALFKGAETSTRLKMMGVDVITLGDPLQPGDVTVFESEDVYRHLLRDGKNRLVGALIVGAWAESGQVQAAVQQRRRLKAATLKRFRKSGRLWSETETCSPLTWPQAAVVCNCMHVSKGAICNLIESGVSDPDRISSETGAGTVCGSCRPLVAELAGEIAAAPSDAASRSRPLLWLSGIAAILAALIFAFPPIPFAESVTDFWYKVDFIWRDFATKQATGYTLMGLSLIGLIMSLRKRLSWFTFGNFVNWRAFHAAFGVTSLVGLFAHTGFRFGDNLNFWLMFSFVMLNLLGAFAGVVASLETNGTGRAAVYARRLRPSLTWAHIVLFWPFPVLLCFHILSAYLY